MKTSNLRSASWAIVSTAVTLFVSGCTVAASEPIDDDGAELALACRPEVPAELAVPDGNKLRFVYDAIGVQIYGCDATAAGYGWVLRGPDAKLYGHKGRETGIHYAGPTWEANDGSTVVAAKRAEYAADPTAVPWLLLGAVSHTGQGRMSDVTFIHRLETTGGKAPASGCDAAHVGDTVRVDYTAAYYFYEARGKKK